MPTQAISSQKSCAIGPAVPNTRVDADVLCQEGKDHSQFFDSVGGRCANELRAARNAGATCRPVMMQADDCTCLTVRPPLPSKTLSTTAAESIRNANWTVIAPMNGDDFGLLMSLLQRTRRSILQLSASQLAEPERAVRLAKHAHWTIVNDQELRQWSGCDGLVDGINWLRHQGVLRFLVTSATGVAIIDGGTPTFDRSVRAQHLVGTVGACDVFAGTFAAGLCAGMSTGTAVRQAQQAAATHLAGLAVQVSNAEQNSPVREREPAVDPVLRRPRVRQFVVAGVVVLCVIVAGFLF